VDAKDFRLLVALDADARQSLHSLGRRVSLSAPAVRERLHHLEERGIIQGFWVSIDPAIFGRADLLVHFGGDWSRDEAAHALDAPDVAWVAWKLDGGITVQLWPRDATAAVQDLGRFLSREPGWRGVGPANRTSSLSSLDWRVLDALIDAPRASADQLSLATGLSPKTVRNHLDGLIRNESIFVVPRLGSLTDSGEVVYHLLVSGTAALPDVRRALGDAVLIHETAEPPRKYLFCRAESLGDLTTKTHAVERLGGVSSVEVTLNREMLLGLRYVHSLVRGRIDESKAARATRDPRRIVRERRTV
jgi:DNA-binding Lrp family transcriptional regulator